MTYTQFEKYRGQLDIKANPGKKLVGEMINDVSTMYADLRLRAQVQISVAAATAIRNRGRPSAMLANSGWSEAGKNVWEADPRVLSHATEALAPRSLTVTPLISTAVGTYDLAETIRLPFSHPYSVDPRETWFREKNIATTIGPFIRMESVADALSRLVEAGSATVALNSFTASLSQTFGEGDPKLPAYRMEVTEIVTNIGGANPKLEIPLKITEKLRAISVSQENDDGEQKDIILTGALRGDKIIWIEDQPWDDFAQRREFESAGDVYNTAQGRHVYINFQQFGRLSRVLDTGTQDTNTKLVLGVQPGAGTVAKNPKVRVTLWQLTRPDFVGAGGRRIIDPAPKFPLVG